MRNTDSVCCLRSSTLAPALVLSLASLIALTNAAASDGAEFKPDRHEVYKKVGTVELKLHIFEPQSHQPTDQATAVVFFFGGGWAGGTPKQFYQQARFLADHGIVGISAEYRVKSRHKASPFECVADGKSAIRWVRQHSQVLGINPERIVASGGSAGGHVAACAGVIEGYDEEDEDLSVSSIPNAMILFNPVLDTTAKGFGLKRVGESRQTDISPCHHVHAGIVPTLLFHGTADKTVPFENAERFTRLMQEAGNSCQLISFPGKGHGVFNGAYFRPKNKNALLFSQTMDKSLEFLTALGYLESGVPAVGSPAK